MHEVAVGILVWGLSAPPGKSTKETDVVEARFVELVPNVRIVQRIEFKSGDPAFARPMKMTWSLAPTPAGTEVTFVCEDVPEPIRPEDHEAALNASLDNLARFVE